MIEQRPERERITSSISVIRDTVSFDTDAP